DWENAFYSIQMALTAAKRLGTSVPVEIWVAAGTYPEHHLMVTESVSLFGGFHGYENQRNERRLEARFRSIVDGQKRGRVFELRHRTVLDGFVIENGREWTDNNDAGAAILTYDADIVLRNCLIRQNVVSEKGVIFINGRDKKKSRNGHSPLIEQNVIVKNSSRNGAAGIFCRDSRAIIRNNTIVGNRGDGIRIAGGENEPSVPVLAHFENNILTLNEWHSSQDVADFAQKAVSYSYIGQRWSVPKAEQPFGYGIGNIFSDEFLTPGFITAESGDFHLAPNSPCIDAGNPASSPDSDSSTVDLGAFSYSAAAGKLDVSISKIVFDSHSKGQKFQIRGYGSEPIKWQIATSSKDGAEFEVVPSTGTLRNGEVVSIAVLPQRKRLSDGQYHGWLAILTDVQSREIELIVNNAIELPELHANPEQVELDVDLYGARLDPIPVKIENYGGGDFTWTVFGADQAKWLKILSKNGSADENLWLQLEITNLEFGNYYHELTIRAAGTINQEIRIPV
ncbi:right-handed parallel beta-helix repeat-containing protein, partial [bacterium]|nr:right-handed parallel beta-helix repeat-containing protein [bacterium]